MLMIYLKYRKLVGIIFITIILINLFLSFLGGWLVGVSTDEPVHVHRLRSYFEFGWYLPVWQIEQGVPKAGLRNTFVYGPIAALFAHLVAVVLSAEQYGVLSFTSEAYAARHISIGLLSLVTLIAVSGVSRLIIGTWFSGLVSAALLSSLPLWSGHAMFNIKDIPVACGYALWTLGFLLIYRGVLERKSNLVLSTYVLITVSGLTLAIGTRSGMWVFAVMSASIAQLIFFRSHMSRENRTLFSNANRKIIFLLSLSFCLAYLLLVNIYPKAFDSAINFFLDSAVRSSNYDIWNGGWLTNGYFHSQPPRIWYWPTWLSYQTPMAVLGLWLIGFCLSFFKIFKLIFKNHKNNRECVRLVGLTMIIAQALLGPIASIMLNSTVYSGTRQFLFIYPALSVLGTIGIYSLIKCLIKYTKNLTVLAFSGGIIFFSIVSPTLDQWRLFPYSYTYLNELATLKPIQNRWPTDYWFISKRALIEMADSKIVIDCRGLPPEPLRDVFPLEIPEKWVWPFPADLMTGEGCGNSGDLYLKQSSLKNSMKAWDKFYLIGYNISGYRIPDNCTLAHEESRELRGQKFIMGWLAICKNDANVISR
jgi:hypothetical protein